MFVSFSELYWFSYESKAYKYLIRFVMQPLWNPSLCSSTGKIRLAVFVNDEVLLQYFIVSDVATTCHKSRMFFAQNNKPMSSFIHIIFQTGWAGTAPPSRPPPGQPPQGSSLHGPLLPGSHSNVIKAYSIYTVKKVSDFPVPSGDVTNRTLPGGRV